MPYSSSKGGIVQLAKSFAVAWAGDNIQSNAILPGWFMTELTQAIPETQPERYDLINKPHTHGTLGRRQRVAGRGGFSVQPGVRLRDGSGDHGGRGIFGGVAT